MTGIKPFGWENALLSQNVVMLALLFVVLNAPAFGAEPRGGGGDAPGVVLPAQPVVEKMQWAWLESRANPFYCAEIIGDGYKTDFAPLSGSGLALTIRVSRNGRELHKWDGHVHSVFLERHHVLYYAAFDSARAGCRIVAYDLKSRKRKWNTRLVAVPINSHSKYNNSINMAFVDNRIVVYGKESAGRYIELLDLNTGRTVGHRILPRNEKAAESKAKPIPDQTGNGP